MKLVFPYLCYKHGGATFLIAYIIMLLVAGLPLFFLELCIGQYSGKGPIKLFGRIAPAMKGLGHAMLVITFLVVIYYNMIIAWTIFYTFAGFTSELPWSACDNTNLFSQNCYTVPQEKACFANNTLDTFWNKECTAVEKLCESQNLTLSNYIDAKERHMCTKVYDEVVLDTTSVCDIVFMRKQQVNETGVSIPLL
jgi:hypothetical protein